MLEQFRNWFDDRRAHALQWKGRTGGKVLGCFCTCVPEEIVNSSDALIGRCQLGDCHYLSGN